VFGFGKKAAKLLRFYRKRKTTGFGPDSAVVQLWAPDSSNYFSAGIELGGDLDWRQINLQLGADNEVSTSNEKGKWTKVGNPSWNSLSWICFKVQYPITVTVLIDGLYFDDIPYSATAEDATSIAKYGTKEAEPIIDQTLLSDAECQAKATEIIEAKKNPSTTIEPFTVDGDARYKPGDLIQDGAYYYRIIKVEHTIAETQWDAKLTVSEV